MLYIKIKKIVSLLLIFSILFLQTVRVPALHLISTSKANHKEIINIISIIVDQDYYSGNLKSNIENYALNIQKQFNKTRSVIIPINKLTEPNKIASLNESLYF